LSELKAIASGNANQIGSLTNVEIAFIAIPSLDQVSLIHNLVSLTLICTTTKSLAGVETAAHSLEILDCTGCELTSIEPCFKKLVNLRSLNLADNKITKI
jgi:Leucine-rich repeat (LRR) protein